ncbi:DUF1214 domain-containing protein [Parahaliea mediterranea]|uniref:DUF1214 domain-containing protein n=1 Tax=Parahaliea mediterranea TaxID=651086 RepID=UPI000E2F04BA|nr:DUF1214 domain-containing protein [Parahaliea mediterranea]
MDRREFLQGAGTLGGLSMLGASLAGAAGSDSASRTAMADLIQALAELEAKFISPAYGIERPDDVAEGERVLAHILQTGLQFWLEADTAHPAFVPYVTQRRKLLGDNPDALYYFAPVQGGGRYRIRGQLGSATFTSFTVEAGSGQGGAASASIAELDDRELEVAVDGSFEILLGGEQPARGNWLPLPAEAGQVTTRHYYETPQCVMSDPAARQVLSIEALDAAPPAPWGGDSAVALSLQSVANFVRGQMPLAIPNPAQRPPIPWVSLKPNQFAAPGQWRSESGYGNLSAWYAMAPYVVMPGQALEIRGRFPDCRFANVVLWNRFMQTYDYTRRQVSFNRNQLVYEDDGSFRILLAHEDPGHPNWLHTEGRVSGLVYWRYLLPRGEPQAVQARVVSL